MRCTLDGALKIPGRRPPGAPGPPRGAARPPARRTVCSASRFTQRAHARRETGPLDRTDAADPEPTQQPQRHNIQSRPSGSPRKKLAVSQAPAAAAMAPPEPRSVVAWLDTVKRGYGKRYSKYFDELGIEDEEDVRRMRPARVDELREILAKANAVSPCSSIIWRTPSTRAARIGDWSGGHQTHRKCSSGRGRRPPKRRPRRLLIYSGARHVGGTSIEEPTAADRPTEEEGRG